MRIWVTGIGVLSPLANSAAGTMARLLAGDRAFGPLSLFELPDARSQVAAEVRGLDVAAVAGAQVGTWSRTDAMAVLAAREALARAGLEDGSEKLDLVFGGTTAGMFETEAFLAEMARDSEAIAPRRQMLSHPLSATVDRMRTAVAPFRAARTVCSACSSSANALVLAAIQIQRGRAERVLAGGADGLCRLTYAGFGALGALSPDPCRPFDEQRSGLSLGEGAAFLVLESAAAARRRGAEPLAELRGFAIGAEAHHITNPEPTAEVVARLMKRALARAELQPEQIDYVNAHGTATRANDPMEARALERCFGHHLEALPVSSSKGQVGHTLGAAGALEAAITAMALGRQVVPPTAGLERPDPACALRHVLRAEERPLRAAMSSSFGFGGMDTVLVFARPGVFEPQRGAPSRPVLVAGAATVGPLGVRSGPQLLDYLAPGPPPAPGAIDFDAAAHLDVGRARRVDRAGRLTTTAVQAALAQAGLAPGLLGADMAAGAIVGSAWGAVDASASYVDRVLQRGAKLASPAAFPNLVPSSPVAHASIYLGLRGPVFASFDLDATAEGAMITAIELVEAGEASLMAAGSVEESSRIAERALAPVCSGRLPAPGPRSEGAQVVLFESLAAWRRRAAGDDGTTTTPLALVAWTSSWRGGDGPELAELGPPPDDARAVVLVGRGSTELDGVLDRSAWRAIRRRSVAERTGSHEGAGGVAVAVAAALVGAGEVDLALAVGQAPDRGVAILLRPVDVEEATAPP